MTLFPQLLLDVHDELIVDLFAGGGGASVGIELATGRQVDVAINHDDAAVALHRKNHPQTDHHVSDVFEVDPREVTNGREIGLLWASPDCTFYSKARGGKPMRSEQKKRRALAWVVKRWAGQVRPRVIMMENVEEFADWGPLVGPPDDLQPCPKKKGRRFRRFVKDLEELGYEVEWRELRACDYGAPTIRKRLFLVARCDGEPIVWPEPTHGPETERPYRTAAECIDWTYPMLSIFATREEAKLWARARRDEGWKMGTPRRPLADATMRRIARGVVKYVLEAPEPYVVSLAHGASGGRREYPIQDPLGTQHSGGNKFALVAPHLIPRYGERKGQAPRTLDITEPHPVVVPTGNGASLVASYLARHWGGMVGKELTDPHPTVLTKGAQDQLVAASLSKLRGTSSDADPNEPLHTVSAGGTHHGVVSSLIRRKEESDGPDGDHTEAGERGDDGSPAQRRSLEEGDPRQPSEHHPDRAPEGGKRDGERVPGREGLRGEQISDGVRPPAGLDGPAGADTRREGHQSHRRDEDQQRPVESGAGDEKAEHPALSPDGPDTPEGVQSREEGGARSKGSPASSGGEHLSGDRREAGGVADDGLSRCAEVVASFISTYYGESVGQELDEPAPTVTTKDRMGLVTVELDGEPWVIVDISMRMLQPRELYRAQGFPDSYVIDRGADGRKLTKTEQVRMVGNSVSPPIAAALVRANASALIARDEAMEAVA